MAVTVRQKSEVVSTGTSPTVVEPAGAASGDVLFAFGLAGGGSPITRPTGWTQLYAASIGNVAWDVSYIARGGSAPSLTWVVTGSVYREVYVVCLQKGGAGSLVLDAQSAAGTTSAASSAQPNPPAVTAIASSSLALCVGMNFAATAVWACTGYTVQTSGGSGNDGGVFSKSLSAAGSEDPAQWTGTLGTGELWNGATVTFTDVASGVTTAQEIPIFDQQMMGQWIGQSWDR